MADLQKHDPLVEAVAKARAAVSARPDILFPTGNINVIGNHIYGYSGHMTFGTTKDVEEIAIEGNTGSFYADCVVQFLGDFTTGDNYQAGVYFNDVKVLGFMQSSVTDTTPYGYYPFHIIIPYNTRVKITLTNTTTSRLNSFTVQLTGTTHQ